jgi:hypothetical protein
MASYVHLNTYALVSKRIIILFSRYLHERNLTLSECPNETESRSYPKCASTLDFHCDLYPIIKYRNILKDLHHDHIVRYHDRHVDREAGILYILMEYCGGGDLSTVIHQALKHNRPIPEDKIWNYFLQIVLALHHCHHPNGHGRSASGSSGTGGSGLDAGGKDRRAQILHRDLKPDNGESQLVEVFGMFIESPPSIPRHVKHGEVGRLWAFESTFAGIVRKHLRWSMVLIPFLLFF